MNDVSNVPRFARSPHRSVQETIASDGDAIRQPPAYRQEVVPDLGSDPVSFDRYISRERQSAEMDRMWTRTWQWACREEHVAEPGDYHVYDIGRHSIIVTRTDADEIKAYHNSCLHRGTKLKPSFSEGSGSKFVCPFHGWTWNLDGELIKVPCAWDFPDMKGDKARLPEVRVALWGGFVFINMDADAEPFESYAYPLVELASHAELENRYIAVHIEKELNCNWKIAQEAFFESYHGTTVHSQALHGSSTSNSQYDILGEHLSRIFITAAVSEPELGEISQQAVLEGFLGETVTSAGLSVPEGDTARHVVGEFFRTMLAESKTDFSNASISELIDNVGYALFPNSHIFMSPVFRLNHRVRPLGDDPAKCLFELILLNPVPNSGRPLPAEPVRVTAEESYASVAGMDPGLGLVYDQDTNNMQWQQEGMAASVRGHANLGNYQEIMIRHAAQTLDRYTAR